MAGAPFALAWTDREGRLHRGYNFRRTSVDRHGNSRVEFYYGEPPTFESTYGDWHTGTAYTTSPRGDVPLGELYTLYVKKSALGRSALDRFLSEADEAGYVAERWFPASRTRAVSSDGSPARSVTFLLRKLPQGEQDDTPTQS